MPARKGLPTLDEIKANTIQSGECWIWQGAFANVYACIRRGGVLYKVHRLAWELKNGYRLGDMDACHKCNNTRCVNPDHIYAGNHKMNALQYHDENLRLGGIHEHGNGWRAKVTVRGVVQRKLFPTKEQAEHWLNQLVLENQIAKRS
jgi:hypothetical protein